MRRVMTTAKVLVAIFLFVGWLGYAAPLDAQSAFRSEALRDNATAKSRKNPTTARILGIVPGLGHLYAGEGGRGAAVVGAFVGVILMAEMIGVEECDQSLYGATDCGPAGAGDVLVAVAGMSVVGFSIWDAGRAAKRTNLRRQVPGRLTVGRSASGGYRVGMRVGF